jgi:hypothetical protein
MVDHSTKVAEINPATARGTAHVIVRRIDRRIATSLVEMPCPIRPHQEPFAASRGGKSTAGWATRRPRDTPIWKLEA